MEQETLQGSSKLVKVGRSSRGAVWRKKAAGQGNNEV